MREVSAIALTIAKVGYEDKVREALEALIEPTRKERGVIQYEMYRDLKEPRRFVFIERWENEANFNAHVNAPHVAEYLRQTEGWIEHSVFYALEKLG